MNNYVNAGHTVTVPAPTGGVLSGVPFAIGNTLAVPVTDAGVGDPVAAKVDGVFDLPKLSSAKVSAGDLLNWSKSGGQFIVTAGANGDLIGCAMCLENIESAEALASVRVKLLPGVGTIKA